MINSIINFRFNSLLGLLLYWLPFGFCAVGYFIRTWRNYQQDKAKRDGPNGRFYRPTDRIGTLLGRGLVATVPGANLCAAIFDVAPEVFGRFIDDLEKVFNTPLVPERPEDPNI